MTKIFLNIKKIYYFIKYLLGKSSYISGNFKCWHDAKKISDGYESDLIFKKLIESNKIFHLEKNIYEVDTCLSEHPRLSKKVSIEMNNIFVKKKKLSIIDYGGGLGTFYFNNIQDLPNIESWNIIEQRHIVDYGKELSIPKINFFFNLDEIPMQNICTIMLFSSSLQYLEKPYETIKKAISKKIEHILIDLTPFHFNEDEIKIQKNPSSVYKASYPLWIFNFEKMLNFFEKNNYKIKYKYKCKFGLGPYNYRGVFFELNV